MFAFLLCALLSLCLGPAAVAENGVFTIPADVSVIESEAFSGNTGMTEVRIPADVTTIGSRAFYGCNNLNTVYYDGNSLQWNQINIASGNTPLTNAMIIFCDGLRQIPVIAKYFPDDAFRGYVSDTFDTDGNGTLSTSEIQAIETIDCSRMEISSVKGVEFFTELSSLDCGFNSLTELDVRNNTKLETLFLAGNSVSSLDVSRNTELRILSCGTELQENNGWNTYGNNLSELDVSHNPLLEELECPGNQLSTLNVSNNPALKTLACWSNNLSSLDLSYNLQLTVLACANNPITSLNLLQNSMLEQLHCQNCSLTSLELSGKSNLTRLRCQYNHLTYLNVSNCTSLLSLNCANNNLTNLYTNNCIGLESLYCGYNQLTSLYLQPCTGLLELNCIANNLTALDLSNNPALQFLGCWQNQLSVLDLTQNTALIRANLSANHGLYALTLGDAAGLEVLWVMNTSLTTLEISGCPLLVEAYSEGTQIEFNGNGTVADPGSGSFVGYKLGSGLNPGSSSEVDHCSLCVNKDVQVYAALYTEVMEIAGKSYTATYFGRQDMSDLTDDVDYRDFWRLENAYGDFMYCTVIESFVIQNSYPMPVEAGQVIVIKPTLKNGEVVRVIIRCDGDTSEGKLIMRRIIVDEPIRTDSMTVGGKNYTATYYGHEDISSWNDRALYREFWRLENAYWDFASSPIYNNLLPQSNYPMPISSGQIYVIEYTMRTGEIKREVMRCDGNYWEGQVSTWQIIIDEPIDTEGMVIGGKYYTATYYGYQDMSYWHEDVAGRDFWRLENAYQDFAACPLTGEWLPQGDYPMPIAAGQVFVIDYTFKNGGTTRRLMRCDGDTYEGDGQYNTHGFYIE